MNRKMNIKELFDEKDPNQLISERNPLFVFIQLKMTFHQSKIT